MASIPPPAIPPELAKKLLTPSWRLKNLYHIRTKDGRVNLFVPNAMQSEYLKTETKRDIILKARQLGACALPQDKILTKDLKWVSLDEVKVGQEIVSVDEKIPGGKGKGRKMRSAIVEAKSEVFEDAFRLLMADGRTLTLTSEHKMLSLTRGGDYLLWKKVKEMKVGDVIRFVTKPWSETTLEDSWFSGMLDGEGSFRVRDSGGIELSVSQVEGLVWSRLVAYAQNSGFHFRIEWDNRKGGQSSKLGNKPVGKIVFGRMDEIFQLLGKTRPTRFIGLEWWEGKDLPGKGSGIGWSKIETIEKLHPMRMIDLQTSSKTFVLNGFVSHNSTVKLLTYLDRTLFTPNTTTCIMAHRRETMEKLFRIIKFAYDMYPKEIPKLPAKYDNKNELYFPDFNSTIYVSMESRGDSIANLHISELAHMENAEDRLIASMASVPPQGRISIESTANGVGDYFYDFYHEAHQRGFKRFFFPWTMAPEYQMDPSTTEFSAEDRKYQTLHSLSDPQLAWWKMQKMLFKEKFSQEFPITPQEAFLATGNNVFPIDYLDNAVLPSPVVDFGDLKIWKHPHYLHNYSMGIDVSEGTGGDEHSFDIIDNTTGEQVLHWSGQCTMPLLAEKVEEYAHKYNEAFLIPEANNHGFSLIYLLDEKRLNIYKREKFDMGQTTKRVEKLGWLTTKRTKPLMIQQMIRAIYESDIKIYCQKTIEQMRTFLNLPDGSMGAAPGKHDDCVMSLCLAWQGIRVAPSKQMSSFSILEDDFSPRVKEFYGQTNY